MVACGVVRFRCLLVTTLACAGCVPEDRPKAHGSSSAAPSALLAAPSRPRFELATERPAPDGGHAPPAGALITAHYSDNFERPSLGPDWYATGGGWTLREGRLCVANAHNHPLWLLRRLPVNARIEFEATSSSPEGDLKVEAWGDGLSAATGISYTNATSYVIIFGGWKNTLHVLARLDEHAADRTFLRVEPGETDPRAQPVLPDRAYRFKIERSDGQTVRYFVDDIEILSLKDKAPLVGDGHEHFAFNDWEVPVCFDNLNITPLKS